VRAARAILLGVAAALGIAACDVVPFGPGGQGGAPQIVCQDIPENFCQMALDSVDPTKRPVSIVVRCTMPVCTEIEGDSEIRMQFADGHSEVVAYAWTTAPEPAVPQEPPEPAGS